MLHRMLVLVVALALAVALAPAAAAEPETEAANAAVDYIKTLQNPDGGFPAFGEESAPGSTIDAVFALAVAGQDPLTVTADGISPADYLATQAGDYVSDPGAAAKLALGVSVLGLDPGDFAGLDLLTILAEGFDSESGSYGLDLFDEAFFILALAGAGEPVPDAATQHLRSARAEDGGWEFLPGDGSDSNTTALVLQALVAAGVPEDDHGVAAALGYLRTVQNPDGGFGFLPGEESDPNTTAFVVQALVAAGEGIDVGGPWAPGGTTPLEALLAFQNPATGAFQFGGEDSPFATYQAVPALMLAPFPDLESRLDGESAPASPTPAATPTPLGGATPSPTAPSAVAALPSTGGGPGGVQGPWWAVAALLIGGAGVVGAGALRRRVR